ncbi:hypothetical protein [Oleiphilus sp. HI0125]|uniref:hypothetical protein n=3 Tax=Oleiphilus sp. HI0125 TaxID=1822266 RepID=UPI000A53BBE2|nr:hypothetical protein [Oleiphilus sp. HI0125]
MRTSIKLTFMASVLGVSAVVVLMNQDDTVDPSFLPVTEQVPTPSPNPDSHDERVSGVQGSYPKYLTTDTVIAGDVEMPPQDYDPELAYDAKMEAWSKVDLDVVREATTDNLYWTMAAQTDDPSIVEAREAKRAELKAIETKMMARHASEQEIRDYYAYQEKLSEDYVIVLTEILERYGNVLPEDDYAGQALARTMHLNKLQEMPNKISRALEQRQIFIDQKQEWMADKDAYRAKLEAQAEEANRALGKI